MNATTQDVVAKLTIWSVVLAGLVLAIFFGLSVSEASYTQLIFITSGVALAVWVVVARDRWWLPFPVAVAMGGFFYFGFRIFIHELMLAACLLPLIVNIATRKEIMTPFRQKIPPSVILLAFFMFSHWMICLIYNQVAGFGGAGSTTRQYMNAAWPLIIFFAFYLFGNSRHLRTALLCMYFVYLGRFLLGLYIYLTSTEAGIFEAGRTLIYIPFINYVPSAGHADDLRGSTIGLAALSLAYGSMSRNGLLKLFHYTMTAAAVGANLLGGGRAYFAICMLLVSFWALVNRKMLPIVLFGTLISGLLILINLRPEIIETLDLKVQRTLSGFIVTTDTLDIQKATAASDDFHKTLREAGYRRWTENLRSILVGHGVRPFDESGWSDRTRDDVTRFSEQAMLTGRYEKGLWTVLATFGAVGFVLYLNVMRFLVFDAARLLWKNRIRDTEHAFYFLATFGIVSWIVTLNITGGFPSQELMMGLFAKVAHEDSLRRKALLGAPPPSSHVVPA
jgi:hypothetical protein